MTAKFEVGKSYRIGTFDWVTVIARNDETGMITFQWLDKTFRRKIGVCPTYEYATGRNKGDARITARKMLTAV